MTSGNKEERSVITYHQASSPTIDIERRPTILARNSGNACSISSSLSPWTMKSRVVFEFHGISSPLGFDTSDECRLGAYCTRSANTACLQVFMKLWIG